MAKRPLVSFLVIAGLLLGFKFTLFEKRKYLWKEGEYNYLYLESVPKKLGTLEHPQELSLELLREILLAIEYQRPWVNIPFTKPKGKQYQLFLPEEIEKLIPHLVEGFKQANSSQWLNFSVRCQRGKLFIGAVRITDGVAFIKEGKLNLVFRNIAEKLGVDENLNTSNPLKYYPGSAYLVEKEGFSLKRNKRSKPIFNWLVVDLKWWEKKLSASQKPEEKIKEKPEETAPSQEVKPEQAKPVKEGKEKSIKERLLELKELYEEGLISEEEYKKKRQEILDQL